MPVVFPRCTLLALAVLAGDAANAAPVGRAAIEPLLELSPGVTFSQGVEEEKAQFRGRLQQFANGDTLLRVGEGDGKPVMLIVCSQSGWINPVGETGSAAPLGGEQLKAVRMMQYMGTLTGVAMVQGLVGDGWQLPASAEPVASTGSNAWAYGREQFDITTRRLAGQELQVRAVKTSNGASPHSTDPKATFSTDEDRAARLAELEPVGTWRELVITEGERPASLPADMSLTGWLSSGAQGAVATVGEARRNCSKE